MAGGWAVGLYYAMVDHLPSFALEVKPVKTSVIGVIDYHWFSQCCPSHSV